MRKLKVKFNEIIDAMEPFQSDVGPMAEYRFDLQTGECIEIHRHTLFAARGEEDTEGEDIWGEIDEPTEEEVDKARTVLEDQSGRYVEIPQAESRDNFRIMEKFAGAVEDEKVQAVLEFALRGPKPFRRFKDALLQYPTARQRWFDFENEMKREEVRDWLESLDIEGEDISPKPGGK